MTIGKIFTAAFSLVLLAGSASLSAAETNETSTTTQADSKSPAMADLENLVRRINTKIQNNQTSATNLEENLREFDQLLVKYKDAKEDDRAQILLMKAQLYTTVLEQPEKGVEVLKQFQKSFPNKQLQGDTSKVIQALEQEISTKKIHDALAVGNKFPDFSETDLNGKPLSVAGYKGKVVLIDFWATWCMPCVMSLPDVIQAYKTYHSKGFEVIGVSLDENPQTLKRFIRDREMEWPQYNDGKRWDNKLAMQYGIQAIPATFLIGRDGKIIGADLRGEELENAIKKALGDSAGDSKSAPAKTPKS